MVGASRRKGVNLDALALLPDGSGWLMVEFGLTPVAEAGIAGGQSDADA